MTLGTKSDWTEEQALKESKMLDLETILAKIPKYAEQLKSQNGIQWKNFYQLLRIMISLGKNPPLQQSSLSAINTPVQIMVGDKDK